MSGMNKVYYFTRYMIGNQLGTVDINNINPTYFGFNFSLQDVAGYTEFTALYDMYKINAVKIVFLPQITQNISLGSINNPEANARFYTALDFNDATAPTSVDAIKEYKTCRYTPILRAHKRYIYKPKILDTNGFSINPWMSTTNTTANFYGIKGAVEPMFSTTTTDMSYTIECKFYLAFKNVK